MTMRKRHKGTDDSRTEVRSMQIATGPIEILMQEHENALHYTAVLDQAAERIQKDGFSFDVYMEISDAIAYIDTEVRLHDKKEEDYLFPILVRYLPDQTNALRFEHRELWSAMSQLRMIVRDVADGNIHGLSISELVKASKSVAELLRGHIQRENEIVFPQVRRLFSAKEYQQLTKQFEKARHLTR